MLNGRKAVIYGQYSAGNIAGITRAVAELFEAQGAEVAVIDADEIRRAGLEELYAATQRAVQALQCPDILVLCPVFYPADDKDTAAAEYGDGADFDEMLELNTKNAIRITRAVVPYMKDKRRGEIICVIPDVDDPDTLAQPEVSAVAASMFAFSRNVTMDYIRYHVRSNTVMIKRGILIDQQAQDAAMAALWFACDMSRFIIGEALPIEGGISYA